jgi:hypothetical protein
MGNALQELANYCQPQEISNYGVYIKEANQSARFIIDHNMS